MPEQAATHRLKRITVQEVSLVDRAANKRRFLVTKREEPMKQPVKKEDAAAAAANVAEGAAAKGGAIQQQVKEALTAALAGLAEKIVSVANEVDALEVTDQPAEPAVPETVTGQISEIRTMLDEISSKFGASAAAAGAGETDTSTVTAGAGTEDGEKPAPAAAAKAEEDDKAEPTEQEKSAVEAAQQEVATKGLDPKASADVVAKSVAARLAVPLDRAQTVVAKVGRRMAKKRLEQLGKAIDMLVSLMKELRYETEKKRAAAAAEAAKAGVAKAAAAAAAPAIDASAVDALLASSEELIAIAKASGEDAAKLRTDLATARAEIARLQKLTPASNALPVEKSDGKAPVAWPLDLNAKPAATRW